MKAVNYAFYHLGEDIRDLRKQRGLSVEQFAELIKCRPETVIRIEKGEVNFSTLTLFLILDTLHTNLLWDRDNVMPYLDTAPLLYEILSKYDDE